MRSESRPESRPKSRLETTGQAAMTAEEFGRIADVSRETLDRLTIYAGLLVRWQRRINLVGKSTIADLWRRHMLDSSQLAKLIPGARPGARPTILDLGSGAGFPGLVIAVVTGLETHLIESNGRKCAFLQEAVRETAAPAQVHHGRIEDLTPWPADAITARALAPVAKLLDYAHPFLSLAAGADPVCLFLKGAKAEEELTEAAKRWHMGVERHASASGDAGVILRIRGVSRG